MIKKYFTLVCALLILVSCSKESEPDLPVVLSSQNTLTSFALTINGEIVNGDINQLNRTITFSLIGAELSSLKPTIQYSEKAKISPAENENQNFDNKVEYTVIAENGDSNTYKVIISNRPISTENKILSFSTFINNENIAADIDHNELLITFNSGKFDRTSLSPQITLSEYATISPDPTIPQNFERPVIYTVTAENGEVNEYKIMANLPVLADNYSTSRPLLLYTRANLLLSGSFLDPNLPGAELYLFDGTNEYTLPILQSESYDQNEYTTSYSLYTKIPENIPTYNNYKITFRTNNSVTQSEYIIDVLAENAPKFISLNQTSYSWNDVLVINGENLTEIITIPSNGSVFLVKKSGSFDYTLNSTKTQISLILDYYYFFPGYFGNPIPEKKTISFRGQDGRKGESFTTTFN